MERILDKVSWDDLKAFQFVAEHRSLRAAAEASGSHQGTMTRRIETLERIFGLRLLQRTRSGIRITREGRDLLQIVQKMSDAGRALDHFAVQDYKTRGVIRCTVTEGIGVYWLTPMLPDFYRENPYTVIDLNLTMSVADLAHLERDVAIQIAEPTDLELIRVQLGFLHVRLFASRVYLQEYGTPASLEELRQHKLIDQIGPQIPHGLFAKLLGIDDIEGMVVLRTPSSTAHFFAIEMGQGIGALPNYSLALGADIVQLNLEFARRVPVWLAYHPALKGRPNIERFIKWTRSIFDVHKFPWFAENAMSSDQLLEWRAHNINRFNRYRGLMAQPSEFLLTKGATQ